MAGYPGVLSRVTRQGLTKGSGWDTLASSAFFTPDPPDEAHNTFNDLTSAAAGAHTVGTGAATLEALTSAAAGARGAAGTSAATLLAATSTASGAHVTGTSAVTLAAITSSSTGTAAGGTSAVTLAAVTSSASGARGAGGTASPTLAAITSAGAGLIPPVGGAATILASLTSRGRAGYHAAGSGLGQLSYNFENGVPDGFPPFQWNASAGEPDGHTIADRADALGGTTKALQFPDIGNYENAWIDFTVWATADTNALIIRYETDSEGAYDFFRVYLYTDLLEATDETLEASGQGNGWFEYSTTLEPGDYILRLEYSKDSSVSEGQDTAWVSALSYPYGDIVPTGAGAATLSPLTSSAAGEASARRGPRVTLHATLRRCRVHA